MKKNVLAVLLCVSMSAALIAGCADDGGDTKAAATVSASEESETAGTETQEMTTESMTETSSAEETAEADTEAVDLSQTDITSPAEGVLIDAAMSTLIVQFAGGTVTFSKGDDVKTSLADGLILGTAYKFTFDGQATDDPSTSTLTAVDDTDMQPLLIPDAIAPIGSVILAAEGKDLAALSAFVKYPVYVGIDDGLTIDNADDFKALDPDKVFTDELLDGIRKTDLVNLQPSKAGAVIGDTDNGHTIIIDIADDGTEGITGINP